MSVWTELIARNLKKQARLAARKPKTYISCLKPSTLNP